MESDCSGSFFSSSSSFNIWLASSRPLLLCRKYTSTSSFRLADGNTNFAEYGGCAAVKLAAGPTMHPAARSLPRQGNHCVRGVRLYVRSAVVWKKEEEERHHLTRELRVVHFSILRPSYGDHSIDIVGIEQKMREGGGDWAINRANSKKRVQRQWEFIIEAPLIESRRRFFGGGTSGKGHFLISRERGD